MYAQLCSKLDKRSNMRSTRIYRQTFINSNHIACISCLGWFFWFSNKQACQSRYTCHLVVAFFTVGSKNIVCSMTRYHKLPHKSRHRKQHINEIRLWLSQRPTFHYTYAVRLWSTVTHTQSACKNIRSMADRKIDIMQFSAACDEYFVRD